MSLGKESRRSSSERNCFKWAHGVQTLEASEAVSRTEGRAMLKKKSSEESSQIQTDWIQVRRCHRCGKTHEGQGERVEKCEACGAHFAPYFFADLTPSVLSDPEIFPVPKPYSLAIQDARNYRAIIGVTWWWSDAAYLAGETRMPRA